MAVLGLAFIVYSINIIVMWLLMMFYFLKEGYYCKALVILINIVFDHQTVL